MSKKAIHIHIVRGAAKDAGKFEESKHPRADDGKFGAGVGKSHAEHAGFHAKKMHEHATKAESLRKEMGQKFGAGGRARKDGEDDPDAHSVLAGEHKDALVKHASAEHGIISSKKAHEASNTAHRLHEAMRNGGRLKDNYGEAASKTAHEASSKLHGSENNGQFGAGVGKSHAEHQEHHDEQADMHSRAERAARAKGDGEGAALHRMASRRHMDATKLHSDAHSGEGDGQDAHAASKVAHEMSNRAAGSSKKAEDN